MTGLQARQPTNRVANLGMSESCLSSPQRADRLCGPPIVSFNEIIRPKLKAVYSY